MFNLLEKPKRKVKVITNYKAFRFVLYKESHADFSNRENTLHTNLLHKFGAEQINGKPKRKIKIIAKL